MLKQLSLNEEQQLIKNVQDNKDSNNSFQKIIDHYAYKISCESRGWARSTLESDVIACIHRALYKACTLFDFEKQKSLWTLASRYIIKFVLKERKNTNGIVRTKQCPYSSIKNMDPYTCNNECGLRDQLDRIPDCRQHRHDDDYEDVYLDDSISKEGEMVDGSVDDENLDDLIQFDGYRNSHKDSFSLNKEIIRKRLNELSNLQQSILKDFVGFGLDYPLSITDIADKNNISVKQTEMLKEEAFMRLKEKNIRKYDSQFLTL